MLSLQSLYSSWPNPLPKRYLFKTYWFLAKQSKKWLKQAPIVLKYVALFHSRRGVFHRKHPKCHIFPYLSRQGTLVYPLAMAFVLSRTLVGQKNTIYMSPWHKSTQMVACVCACMCSQTHICAWMCAHMCVWCLYTLTRNVQVSIFGSKNEWNVTKIEISPKRIRHKNWNVAKTEISTKLKYPRTEMSTKLKCTKTGMSLKSKMSPKQKYHQNGKGHQIGNVTKQNFTKTEISPKLKCPQNWNLPTLIFP